MLRISIDLLTNMPIIQFAVFQVATQNRFDHVNKAVSEVNENSTNNGIEILKKSPNFWMDFVPMYKIHPHPVVEKPN